LNDQWAIKEIREGVKNFFESTKNEKYNLLESTGCRKSNAKGKVYSYECHIKNTDRGLVE
jgi:hypothetical protein